MFFGPEPGIKIRIFAYAAGDPFQGDGLNAVIDELHIFFLGLLFMERVYVIDVFLPGSVGRKQIFEKIFHGSGLYQGKSTGIDDLRVIDACDSV
jgi:hypothetical protein